MRFDALRVIALAAVCAAFQDLGCTATVVPGPAPQIITTGRATLQWTINGSTDPNLCYQSQVARFDVTIYYSDGTFQGEYTADCTVFSTTIDLPGGNYYGDAKLLDGNNNPRTSPINVDPFDVVGGSNYNIPLDFPSSSFL